MIQHILVAFGFFSSVHSMFPMDLQKLQRENDDPSHLIQHSTMIGRGVTVSVFSQDSAPNSIEPPVTPALLSTPIAPIWKPSVRRADVNFGRTNTNELWRGLPGVDRPLSDLSLVSPSKIVDNMLSQTRIPIIPTNLLRPVTFVSRNPATPTPPPPFRHFTLIGRGVTAPRELLDENKKLQVVEPEWVDRRRSWMDGSGGSTFQSSLRVTNSRNQSPSPGLLHFFRQRAVVMPQNYLRRVENVLSAEEATRFYFG